MPTRRTAAVAGAVVIAGIASLALMKSTSPGGDFMDSPWFWWGWVALPVIAAAAAWVSAEGTAYWGWLAVVPQAMAVLVEGVLFHDPDEGASFWLVGLLFVACLGLLASAAARGGRAARLRRV